mgnify:CR=1 FL=1
MGDFIFGTRNNIHIIDLAQTVPLMHQALKAVSDTVAKGGLQADQPQERRKPHGRLPGPDTLTPHEPAEPQRHLALAVLRRLDGSVAFESGAAGGTTVVVDVPFTQLRAAG